MVKKLFNILIGTWRNLIGYDRDYIRKRRKICKSCEHNIKFMGTRICDKCGCVIKSKTAVENEQCNKWNYETN